MLDLSDRTCALSRVSCIAVGWGYDKAGNETDGASGVERARTGGGIRSSHQAESGSPGTRTVRLPGSGRAATYPS